LSAESTPLSFQEGEAEVGPIRQKRRWPWWWSCWLASLSSRPGRP